MGCALRVLARSARAGGRARAAGARPRRSRCRGRPAGRAGRPAPPARAASPRRRPRTARSAAAAAAAARSPRPRRWLIAVDVERPRRDLHAHQLGRAVLRRGERDAQRGVRSSSSPQRAGRSITVTPSSRRRTSGAEALHAVGDARRCGAARRSSRRARTGAVRACPRAAAPRGRASRDADHAGGAERVAAGARVRVRQPLGPLPLRAGRDWSAAIDDLHVLGIVHGRDVQQHGAGEAARPRPRRR